MTGRPFFALVLVGLLGACAVDPQSAYQPTEAQLRLRDWLGPRYLVVTPAVYCYQTIGRPDCYRTPVAGWENRLIAYDGPRPVAH